MQIYLLYIMKVILISAIMYGYYLVALRNKKFHRYNRFYLLSAVFIPLILPFIRFEMIFQSGEKAVPIFIQRDRVMDTIVMHVRQDFWNTDTILVTAYWSVAGILMMFFVASLIRVYYLKRVGNGHKRGRCFIIESDAKGTPFSFFNYIFWNPAISINSEDGVRILKHELTHVRQYHSLDKLVVNLLQVVCWFNLFLWLIKREINVVHEFLADEASVETADVQIFSRMALQSAYPGFTWPANNSLLYSPIKRRLAMLLKNKNQKVSYIGRLMVLPLAGFIFMFFSVKAKDLLQNNPMIESNGGGIILSSDVDSSRNSQRTVQDLTSAVDVQDKRVVRSVSVSAQNNLASESLTIELPTDTIPGDDRIFTKTEHPAEFPGGPAAWHKYVTQRIQATLGKFTEKDYGTCIVKFIVAKDGTVSNVEATTMQGTELARVSVDAISTGPKWVPAKQNGRIVTSIRLQPVTLTNPRPLPAVTEATPSSDRLFTKVEKEAQFPGGYAAWQQYITQAIQRRLDKFTERDYGTCIVKFIVAADGTVSDVEPTTMRGTELATVAVDAITNGPRWIPAEVDGKKVNAYRLQPVTLSEPVK